MINMKIQILRQSKHKSHTIYIRRLDTLFEYLVIYNKKLYSSYIEARPAWYKKLMNEPYTEDELKNVVGVLITMAQSTINKLIEENGR